MISINYKFSSFRNGIETESKTEKCFVKFDEMKQAKEWAKKKWAFLNWPSDKSTRTGSVEKDGKKISFVEWSAEKEVYGTIKKYEMNIVSVGEA